MTEIHEFIRRDAALSRRERSDGNAPAEPAAENLNSLIGRVANASVDEIDGVIRKLKRVARAGPVPSSHSARQAHPSCSDVSLQPNELSYATRVHAGAAEQMAPPAAMIRLSIRSIL